MEGKAFAGSGSGIAQRIQRIGSFAHFRRQMRHFRVAAGIVSHRAVGVGRQGDTQRGSMPTAAIEMPYRPALTLVAPPERKKLAMIAPQTMITGAAVDIIPTAIPLMITVAGPVTAESAMVWWV